MLHELTSTSYLPPQASAQDAQSQAQREDRFIELADKHDAARAAVLSYLSHSMLVPPKNT